MSTTAQAVGFGFVERLAQDLKDERLELPAFPEAVLRIQRLLQDSNTGVDEIVRAISSEPALAARLLRMANSVQFRRMDSEITDLRKAVARMGFNVVRSVAVAFAMRQLKQKDSYSADARAELEAAWRESVEIASLCYVLAKRRTKLNPDQALLTGLLHVLGRLYIIMRAQSTPGLSAAGMQEVVASWHATIAKAILESWGLPEALQEAVERQDDLEIELEGDVTLTDVLVAAKVLARNEPAPDRYAALRRIGGDDGKTMLGFADEHTEEIANMMASLSE